MEGCFDNKFEIRFLTQRPRADGRGVVDDFDIEVRNKNLDRACLVDELSGGQFVLVNEAVNLGIFIYNMQQGDGLGWLLSNDLHLPQTPGVGAGGSGRGGEGRPGSDGDQRGGTMKYPRCVTQEAAIPFMSDPLKPMAL